MKIKKKPKHWPNVSPEQQKEGLKFIVDQVDIIDFEWALKRLTWYKFMKKATMHKLLKRYRKIAGMSYEDWRRLKDEYNRNKDNQNRDTASP